jgi:membrane-associated protein
MDRKQFIRYSALGAVLWVIGVTLLGAALGQIAFVREHLESILLGFVVLSSIPILVEIQRHRRGTRS